MTSNPYERIVEAEKVVDAARDLMTLPGEVRAANRLRVGLARLHLALENYERYLMRGLEIAEENHGQVWSLPQSYEDTER